MTVRVAKRSSATRQAKGAKRSGDELMRFGETVEDNPFLEAGASAAAMQSGYDSTAAKAWTDQDRRGIKADFLRPSTGGKRSGSGAGPSAGGALAAATGAAAVATVASMDSDEKATRRGFLKRMAGVFGLGAAATAASSPSEARADDLEFREATSHVDKGSVIGVKEDVTDIQLPKCTVFRRELRGDGNVRTHVAEWGGGEVSNLKRGDVIRLRESGDVTDSPDLRIVQLRDYMPRGGIKISGVGQYDGQELGELALSMSGAEGAVGMGWVHPIDENGYVDEDRQIAFRITRGVLDERSGRFRGVYSIPMPAGKPCSGGMQMWLREDGTYEVAFAKEGYGDETGRFLTVSYYGLGKRQATTPDMPEERPRPGAGPGAPIAPEPRMDGASIRRDF
ncbi:MAG: hypothetical protein GF416_06640 [Candidatus Altiarchaeales archaeon]|nr:hypothetical protein [Candidatus Altiarchaeales archaeon]MBD3416791.1 hypothetical protein [Candidatus Altiarchaeales archaeon]